MKNNGTLTPTYNSNATRITKSNNRYTLRVTYDKHGYNNNYAQLTVIAQQTRSLNNSSSYTDRVPTSLSNATITVKVMV